MAQENIKNDDAIKMYEAATGFKRHDLAIQMICDLANEQWEEYKQALESMLPLYRQAPNLLERCEQFLSFYDKHKSELSFLSDIAEQTRATINQVKGD